MTIIYILNFVTVRKKLSEKNIDITPDEDLVYFVFDKLADSLAQDYTKEYQTVINWNKSKKTLYIVSLLEGEVQNGGFNQFYYNPSGQFYEHTPEALLHIGATKYATLAQNANDVYEKNYKKITKYQDGSIEGFSKSYENNPLNDFDDQFYEIGKFENLDQLQIDFIRKNKKDFIDKK